MDCNPTAITVVTKVKPTRKAQVDNQMEVDGEECRWHSNMEAIHAQSPLVVQVSPVLSDAAMSQPPPHSKLYHKKSS